MNGAELEREQRDVEMEDCPPEPEEISEPQEWRDALRKEFGDGKGFFTDGSRMKKKEWTDWRCGAGVWFEDIETGWSYVFKGEQSVPKAELVAIMEATQAPKQTGEKDRHIFTDSLNNLLNLKKTVRQSSGDKKP